MSSDRDKLIELIEEWHKEAPTQYLADHLLANGVIVPPCKMDSKIYMLVTRKTHCFEYPNGKMQMVENQHTFIKETYLTKLNFFKVIYDFGKTVFLTKEDAEEKLKELKNNV